jgi:hypothetical protein
VSATAAVRRRHEDWLNLLQRGGPFLTVPILLRTWPAGLDPVPREALDAFRPRLAEWAEDRAAQHEPWIDFVLGELLGWGERLVRGPDLAPGYEVAAPEFGRTVRADLALRGEDGVPLLLGTVHAPGTTLTGRLAGERWVASPADRLALLLRRHGVPVGLATDGRWWALVWAPAGGVTSTAVWDGAIWLEERDTLAAFRCLLERRRFLGVPDAETLPRLLDACLDAQEEITEGLGRQVREAVEMIVQAIGRAGVAGGPAGDLLAAVSPGEIYRGAVSVMMRLVFLLYAEERLLLPADDELYLRSYSASQLVDALRAARGDLGEEALEHRTSAWHRLLSLCRAIHRGLAHDRLRIPAYGGAVFDPDRHPWLEGRRDASEPPAGTRVLAIDDRTVLHALEAVQFVSVRGERRRLTFRTLDVEEIGYVYEGLLGYDALRADEPVVGLIGREGEEPEVAVSELERCGADPACLRERTGLTERRIGRVLAPNGEEARERERLLRAACAGDETLVDRLLPYAGLLRLDLRGLPIVVPTGGLYVTVSSRRRLSGTHYTPRDLAERIVVGALEPLVYAPGPLETADRAAWRLRPSREILALRVADIAMGSGAFLVAACRHLAGKVVEAWIEEGNPRARRPVSGELAERADPEADPVVIEARRLVIEHCLYGGDVNEMAVEMAKLSLWLVSLSRERPFSFLDDRLVCGDSLLGLTSLDQIRALHLDPTRARAEAGESGYDLWGLAGRTLREVEAIRAELAEHPLHDVRDAAYKARLLARAIEAGRPLTVIADALVGAALAGGRDVDERLGQVAQDAGRVLRAEDPRRRAELLATMEASGAAWLETDHPAGAFDRRPAHWPLVFPEVFERGGFDAVVGNPPFLGGQKLTGAFGTRYREFLVRMVGRGARGSADLLAYFVLVAHAILNGRGQTGLIGTNTIAQGDTREVGLDQVIEDGVTIRAAVKSAKWPTRSANLEYAVVWGSRERPADAAERQLDGRPVRAITPSLDPAGRVTGNPYRLVANEGIAFQGSIVLGLGFTMSPEEARRLIEKDARNREVLFPYINGEDLNQRPDCSASRWAINFRDWPLERAEEYPDCIERVRQLVKPERERNKRANYRDVWWRYAEHRPGLYVAIAGMSRVLAIALVSKAVMPVRVPTGQVYANLLGAFARGDGASLALLSSTFHYWWAITCASTLETRIRYTPSDVFETFPQPPLTPRMQAAGDALDAHRRPLMLDRQLGLTPLYNIVHEAGVRDPDVQRLRDLHVEIDHAVAEAYGWDDLPLDHGFHPTRQGMRFTVSEPARAELLDRLLELNHRRHGEEEAQGLTRRRGRRPPAAGQQQELLQ